MHNKQELIPEKNPNDKSALIYDIFSSALKPENLTDAEIALVTARLDKGSKIIDVGGGTGRHALVLAELGYEMTVVDSSSEMLKALQSKADKNNLKSKILNSDIFTVKLPEHEYNMAILFWNSFNEIALNRKQAIKLLTLLRKALHNTGSILINIDDASKVDPAHFDFTTSYLKAGLEYKVHWKTEKYHKKSNTAISKEEVSIFDSKGSKLNQIDSFIKQKYWTLKELQDICAELGFNIGRLKFKTSEELYLIISFRS